MTETQAMIAAWADEVFGPADPASPRSALRLLEEAVELCAAAGASWDQIASAAELKLHRLFVDAPPPGDAGKIPKEAGDVLVTLYRCAAVYGFDLHEHADRCMAINRVRQWKRHGDGTGQHIKAPA